MPLPLLRMGGSSWWSALAFNDAGPLPRTRQAGLDRHRRRTPASPGRRIVPMGRGDTCERLHKPAQRSGRDESSGTVPLAVQNDGALLPEEGGRKLLETKLAVSMFYEAFRTYCDCRSCAAGRTPESLRHRRTWPRRTQLHPRRALRHRPGVRRGPAWVRDQSWLRRNLQGVRRRSKPALLHADAGCVRAQCDAADQDVARATAPMHRILQTFRRRLSLHGPSRRDTLASHAQR